MKVALAALRNDADAVADAARVGPVDVVDENGATLFSLSIPMKPIDDTDWQGLYDQLKAELATLKAAAVPLADYERMRALYNAANERMVSVADDRDMWIAAHDAVVVQRDAADLHVDALLGKCQRQEDSHANVLAADRLRIMRSLGRILEAQAPGATERDAFNDLFAHLAMHGRQGT